MYCAKCGSEIPEGANVCPNCGEMLAARKVTYCSGCGGELPEGANVCPSCGEKVGKDINFSDVTNYAGQRAQQVAGDFQSQVQNIRQSQEEEKASRIVRDVRDMFVDPREEQKAVIGGGYLSNMLQSGVLGKGFGVTGF